jgi:hypothetical protein
MERLSRNHCWRGKTLIHILSVCVGSLGYPASKAHVWYSVVTLLWQQNTTHALAVQSFSTLYHKWRNFCKKVIVHKMCVLISSTTFVWNINLILIRILRDIVINVHGSSCKLLVIFLPDFDETWIYSTYRKILKYKSLWVSVQWEPSCNVRTGGTDKQTWRSY